MRRGLIIGKFMPVHKGHMALIDFALDRCHSLIIAVCTLEDEPIEGNLRFKWVKDIYKDNEKVKVIWIKERLHEKDISINKATKLWGDYLLEHLPEIHVIFSSEEYGDYLSKHMEADHEVFDMGRNINNISATKIRSNPLKYWDYIPDVVKPYFLRE